MSIEDLSGKELIYWVHNWREGLQAGFENSLVVQRFDQGIGEAILLDSEIGERRNLLITARGKSNIKSVVDSLKSLQGRKVSFWFIDLVSPLQIQADVSASATQILIKNNNYILDDRRVYIKKKDGTEITRKINSYTVGESTTDISVGSMPEVLLSDIYCAYILRLMRLDADIPNLVFPAPIVCEVNLPLVELPKEYA